MVRITLDKPYIPIPVPVTAIKYGLLYNFYVILDDRKITSSDEYRVPTESDDPLLSDWLDLMNLMEWELGRCKDSGFDYWDSPNTGAENKFDFKFRGSGLRSYDDGSYIYLNTSCWLWNNIVIGDNVGMVALAHNTVSPVMAYNRDKENGQSICLCRNLREGEDVLPNGMIEELYTGNDGKNYNQYKAGLLIWTDIICETKYRNGDTIPEVTNNAAWAALSTGALCAYNNDWSNVLI